MGSSGDEDAPMLQGSRKDKDDDAVSLPTERETVAWDAVWVTGFASLSCVISSWIPFYFLYGVNVTAIFFNLAGVLVAAIVTSFQQVHFQYYQTYRMYTGIKDGFCSVTTTFGNLIEDTYRLLIWKYWWMSIINLGSTIIGSFMMHRIGSEIAIRWKPWVALNNDLLHLEHSDRRLAHEVDLSLQADDEIDAMTRSLQGGDEFESTNSNVRRYTKGVAITELDYHMRSQMQKHQKHKSNDLQPRHRFILALCAILAIGNYFLVRYTQVPPWFDGSQQLRAFDYLISLMFSIAGALVGNHVSGGKQHKFDVHWGTFRVNMVSCILIGTAHNVLLFTPYLPRHDGKEFAIVMGRFITSFCGSVSSFARFIIESATLYNSGIKKKIALRNFYYNLFVCLMAFIVVTYTVRAVVFFR